MTTEQAYTILRIQPGATAKDIQRAYRARALEYHPDRATSQEDATYLTRKFMEVRDAYEHLRHEGFPVPEPEAVLEDIPPGGWTAGRTFMREGEPEDKNDWAKGPGVPLQSVVLWGVVIPAGAIVITLVIKYMFYR
ncbi:MAG: J domain-containing protein [Elusimicrobiota bacterium]